VAVGDPSASYIVLPSCVFPVSPQEITLPPRFRALSHRQVSSPYVGSCCNVVGTRRFGAGAVARGCVLQMYSCTDVFSAAKLQGSFSMHADGPCCCMKRTKC
jgi:hypothetical protein